MPFLLFPLKWCAPPPLVVALAPECAVELDNPLGGLVLDVNLDTLLGIAPAGKDDVLAQEVRREHLGGEMGRRSPT